LLVARELQSRMKKLKAAGRRRFCKKEPQILRPDKWTQ
jgi:hypothetical protein